MRVSLIALGRLACSFKLGVAEIQLGRTFFVHLLEMAAEFLKY